MKSASSTLVVAVAVWVSAFADGRSAPVQFVFTSDAHYGLTRAEFRGHHQVPAQVVNEALIAELNGLSASRFPDDRGINAGERVGAIDFLVEGGDITNREEQTDADQVQPAAVSWWQFAHDYLERLRLRDHAGRATPVFVVPGNHDASNAVGFHKPMVPLIDKTTMVELFNRMVRPAVRVTTDTYTYDRDKVLYAHDFGGVHFVFLQVWPDSVAREWMARNLSSVADDTPVVIFVHDQPDSDAKHFINPNGRHDINAVDKFENLLSDPFADGPTSDLPALKEREALEAFLGLHRNVTAYFHGNSNWNEFYEWRGPRHTLALHTFRVDSPMKGAVSATDESRLSFQVASIDQASHRMTVRECLWNAGAPGRRSGPGDVGSPHALTWGASVTVSLEARRANSE